LSACLLPRVGAHPAFAPFARWLARAPADDLPSHAELNGWAHEVSLALPDGRTLAFVPSPQHKLSALAYEQRIAERAEIVTRTGSLHDVCNALAWLAFPRIKAALNALHVSTPDVVVSAGSARGRARDAATLLDESGMLVACSDAEILGAWRAHAWREAFVDGRDRIARHMRAVATGHGLVAKCVTPFRALTARALVIAVDVAALPADPDDCAATLDRAAAALVADRGAMLAPADLLPLPVAALPGWDVEGLGARLFDDTSVFRPRAARAAEGGPGHANLTRQTRGS